MIKSSTVEDGRSTSLLEFVFLTLSRRKETVAMLNKQEKFIRFILLLLKAGTDLLREITKKALRKKKTTLRQFLSSSRTKIEEDEKLTKKQIDTLYPTSPHNCSLEDFDITLLSHLVNDYLIQYIDMNEVNAVTDIRAMRNNYYAHVTDATMDATSFTREWNKLTKIIKDVNTGMTPDVMKKQKEIIEHIENDPLVIKELLEVIKDQQYIIQGQEDIIKGQQDFRKEFEAMKERIGHQEKVVESQGKDLENLGKILATRMPPPNQINQIQLPSIQQMQSGMQFQPQESVPQIGAPSNSQFNMQMSAPSNVAALPPLNRMTAVSEPPSAGSTSNANPTMTMSMGSLDHIQQKLMCIKCKRNRKDVVFRPCGHFYLCQQCLPKFKDCPGPGCNIKAKSWTVVDTSWADF